MLYCGDCLEMMPTLAAQSVDLILCDLPYGTTRNKWDSIIPLDLLWAQYRRLARGAVVLTATQPFTSALVMSNLTEFKYAWVWEKPLGTGHLNSKKQPLRNHEDLVVFYRNQPIYNPQMTEGEPYRYQSGRASQNWGSQVSVLTENEGWRYPLTVQKFIQDKEKIHPTQKPVALMEYLIRTYTNPGMIVLDNCMGSGTAGVACINTGRQFIGIERDPEYFKIAQNRILEAALAKVG